MDDPETQRGKALFHQLNCSGCHWPKHLTGTLPDRPEHSQQLVWPYTDLLLHETCPGLTDGLPEGVASGSEWRTPPAMGAWTGPDGLAGGGVLA